MSDRRTDQLIVANAGQLTMEVAKESIIREAERTGQMWMPRIDARFVKQIRSRYKKNGATPQAVDAVLVDFHRDAMTGGLTPELAWITSFQAIVVLEPLAKLDGALDDDDHSLLAHYAERHSESTR